MPFCHQCGIELGTDPGERYCWSCGADQSDGAPAAIVRAADPMFSAWQNAKSGAAGIWADSTSQIVITCLGAVIALMLAHWLGGVEIALLTAPLMAAGAVALARPHMVLRSLAALETWTISANSRARAKQGRISRWLIRPYTGGLQRINSWSARVDDESLRAGIRVAGYWYLSYVFLAALYFAAIIAVAVVITVIALIVGLWILSEYLGSDSGSRSRGHSRGRPSWAFREGEKLTVRRREPGLLDSLFGGSKPASEVVDEHGHIVGTIQSEEPGLLASLTGEDARQVVRGPGGEKIATFEHQAPGLVGSFLGEKGKTVLRRDDGQKLGEFHKEEPGLLGSLVGEKPRTVIRDSGGREIAEVGYEEPGFLGSLTGEKPKRVVTVKRAVPPSE